MKSNITYDWDKLFKGYTAYNDPGVGWCIAKPEKNRNAYKPPFAKFIQVNKRSHGNFFVANHTKHKFITDRLPDEVLDSLYIYIKDIVDAEIARIIDKVDVKALEDLRAFEESGVIK